jgi:hypothetical protein
LRNASRLADWSKNQPGLLARPERNAERDAALLHFDDSGIAPNAGSTYEGQAFELAHAGVVLPQHRRGRDRLAHGRFGIGTHRLHTGRRDLPDDDVAEPVEHQPGQRIGLAVRQAIERPFVQRPPQRLRDLQPVHDERLARRMFGVAPRMRAQINECGLT